MDALDGTGRNRKRRLEPDERGCPGRSHGNVTVLTSNTQQIFAIRFDPVTGQWTAPQAIEHAVADDTVSDQTMVVDPSGNVTAAWVQRDHLATGIFAARYDALSDAWGAAAPVADSPLTGSFPPLSMGADDAGAVTMAWTRDNDIGCPTEIQAAQLDPGASQWTAPQRLDNNTTDPVGPRYPGVAVDAAGHATVAWMWNSGMQAVRRAPGESWSAPVAVASGGLDTWGNVPLVKADVAGNVAVAWLRDSRAVVARFRCEMASGFRTRPSMRRQPGRLIPRTSRPSPSIPGERSTPPGSHGTTWVALLAMPS